ncbi:MAG TPA: RNA polymerase factor sigma-54 [Rhodocyclaceae bacterium]
MKPALQLKLSQHLALTPQLQQSIKLLQLSTLELNQELERYLLENPLLERDEEETAAEAPRDADRSNGEAASSATSDESAGERGSEGGDSGEAAPAADDTPTDFGDEWLDESGSYGSKSGRQDDDEDFDPQDAQSSSTSLREHLDWQVALTPLSDRDRTLVRVLIEALDDDGYLTQALEELAESLPEEAEVGVDELLVALRILQSLDPTGVGARNARECLSLQLKAREPGTIRDLALNLVANHLDQMATRDFAKIKKGLGCDDDQLRSTMAMIRGLDPRPGAKYAPMDTRYITPDVIVRKVRGKWVASVNGDAFPRLRVNRLYAEILSRQRGSGLAGQLQEARWLIKNVQQRFDTIQRVTQAIVDRQRQFFEHGEVAMRPLVLREIADILGLHESTISRVTSQKYMATPRGIFELKYFFGSHVATEAGGACSATAIRALIKQMVAAENPQKPLSDSQISDILGQQGIVVARRTIAKYREALSIPPTNLRKSL